MNEYLTLKKGSAVKFIGKKSKLLPILKSDGWKIDGEESELDALREQAKELGLKPHHKAGAEKIKKMIESAKETE